MELSHGGRCCHSGDGLANKRVKGRVLASTLPLRASLFKQWFIFY